MMQFFFLGTLAKEEKRKIKNREKKKKTKLEGATSFCDQTKGLSSSLQEEDPPKQ